MQKIEVNRDYNIKEIIKRINDDEEKEAQMYDTIERMSMLVLAKVYCYSSSYKLTFYQKGCEWKNRYKYQTLIRLNNLIKL